jgi:hypothetical protein
MNVLILTPDRVGSTLLQRVLTVYMLRREFDKPVINLHELTNGLEKYYNETLNQEVLGKPQGTDWGYYQTLEEIETLLKSADHYKTSRLAHYHIINRKDTITDQIKFYEYLNKNFFIISCRRENLFEHALSWGIQGHSKTLNVYNAEQKISTFNKIYKNKITIPEQTLTTYLNKYKEYINWSDTYFNVQSYWNYDTDIQDIEKYILNLDFMQGNSNNSWQDMFGQNFNIWNTCHRMLPNLLLLNKPDATVTIKLPNPSIDERKWNELKGPDWPQTLAEYISARIENKTTLPAVIEKEIEQYCYTISVTNEEYFFLKKHVNLYIDINSKISDLVKDGFLVTGIPLKLQSLKEKKLIIKNFNQCVVWYNNWAKENNLGKLYSESELDAFMIEEDRQLNFQVEQQNLLQ